MYQHIGWIAFSCGFAVYMVVLGVGEAVSLVNKSKCRCSEKTTHICEEIEQSV